MTTPHPRFEEARAAYQKRDLVTADRLCREILAENRDDFHATMLLADVLGASGHPDVELSFIGRAVQLNPTDARLRAHHGHRLFHRIDYDRAIAEFRTALELNPEQADARTGLALCYEGLHRHDDARAALAPLLAHGPIPPAAAPIHLRLLLEEGRIDEAIAAGNAIMVAGHEPSIKLRNACFVLAKAYERRGDIAEAFDVATRANAILAPPFPADRYLASIDARIARFSRERIDAIPVAPTEDDRAVFIVGMPRVGSTLTERIIHAHPEAYGAGEMGTIDVYLEPGVALPTFTPTEASIALLSRRYHDALTSRAPDGARRVVNKELFNALHLGLISRICPRGRIIHCRRDPVDTCLSCYMERLPTTSSPWASRLEDLGAYVRGQLRLWAHWRNVIDLPLLEVDYEALVADPETQIRRILEFCGLDFDERCLAPQAVERAEATLSHEQVRRPVYRDSVGRAERFGSLLDPLREALGDAAWPAIEV